MPPPAHPTIPERLSEGGGHHWIVYRATVLLLTVVVLLCLVDGIRGVRIFGVDSRTTTAEGGGYRLEVTAPVVSRPGLATPLEIRVERPAGLDQPIELALPRSLSSLFDFQRVEPQPSAERTRGDYTVLEFEPPDGEELVVAFDWRLEPAAQWGRDWTVAVIDGEGFAVAVDGHLRVWP